MNKDMLQPPIPVQYRTFPGSGKILWPVVEAVLSTKSYIMTQPILALIDSGASSSILHALVAEILGFDSQKAGASHKGLTVSGEYESWVFSSPVEIDLYGYKLRRKFNVINNPNLIWPCILGGDSIFEVARIDLQKFKGYFDIRFRKDLH